MKFNGTRGGKGKRYRLEIEGYVEMTTVRMAAISCKVTMLVNKARSAPNKTEAKQNLAKSLPSA